MGATNPHTIHVQPHKHPVMNKMQFTVTNASDRPQHGSHVKRIKKVLHKRGEKKK